MAKPLLNICICYFLGIFIGSLIEFPAWLWWSAGFFILFLAVMIYYRKQSGLTALLLLLAVILGSFNYQVSREEAYTPLLLKAGQHLTLTGRVSREPVLGKDKVTYLVEAEGVTTAGGQNLNAGRIPKPSKTYGLIQVTVKESGTLYNYGDLLELTGVLERPGEPANPGQFNYRKYLEGQGILLTMNIKGEKNVSLVGKGKSNFLIAQLLNLKTALAQVNKATLNNQQAALINGMIFGLTGDLSPELREVFAETGLIHILSVSGFHVGLVLILVFGLGNFLGLSKGWKTFVTAGVLIAYGVMTGLQPPVLRALIMAIIVMCAKFLGREDHWPTGLALAAAVILFFTPQALFEAGFQLSFAATWGILYLAPWLGKLLFFIPQGLRSLLTVPLAAQLATAPLVAYHFNLFSLISIPANLLLIDLTGLLVYLGFLASLGGLLWLPLAGVLNISQGFLADFFIWAVMLLDKVPGAVLYLASPPFGLVVAAYGLLFLLRTMGELSPLQLQLRQFWRQNHKLIIFPGMLIIILVVGTRMVWPAQEPLRVTFLDVGQGDCALVQTPNGRNLLIDSGGSKNSWDVGKNVIIPFLRSKGISKLDTLVLTHAHDDHFGGAGALIKAIPIDLIVISPQMDQDKSYLELLQQVKAKKIKIETAEVGQQLKLDTNVPINFIHPQKKLSLGTSSDLNNNALVLKLTYGQRKFLFTADIEEEAINTLLAIGVNLQADVLKVAHHGSKYSYNQDFYNQVQPKVAVISVGRNYFGHPSLQVIKGLTKVGARVIRTDHSGAVTIECDGVTLKTKVTKELLLRQAN